MRQIVSAIAVVFLAMWTLQSWAGEPDFSKLRDYVGHMKPGTWFEVPGTSAIPILLTESEVAEGAWGGHGSTAVFTAWNGAAFDGQRLYFFGGGHKAYGGNEVYSLDLDTLEWRRLTDPSPLISPVEAQTKCPGYVSASNGTQIGPTASHTYDGIIFVPKENALYVWGSAKFCYGRWGGGPVRAWRLDLATNTWSQLDEPGGPGYVKTFLSPETGNPIVVFNNEIKEYHPQLNTYRSIVRLSPKERPGSAVYDPTRNEAIILSGRGIRRVTLGAVARVSDVIDADAISLRDVNPGQLGIAHDDKRAAMMLWDGARNVYHLDIEQGRILRFPEVAGPAPTRGRSQGVFSKWIYLPSLDVFAGYNNPDEGLWLYRPRPLEDAVPPPAASEPLIAGDIRVCPGRSFAAWCDVTSLQKALDRAREGDKIVLAAGEYSQAAQIRVPGVQIVGEPGAHLIGRAAAGKGALVVSAPDVTIEGIECSHIRVPDRNGACVRIQAANTTIRNVYFHDNDEGILGGAPEGKVVIENSRFERNGRGGRAHSIYISNGSRELVFRNNHVISTLGLGHGLKSRAHINTIENNVIAGLEGPESRAIDLPSGGIAVIRNNVFQKGPNSDNDDMVGIARESIKHVDNDTLIEGNLFIFDKSGGRVISSESPGDITLRGNTIVGTKRIGAPAEASANRFFDDREAAGLSPYPALPERTSAEIGEQATAE